MANGRNGTEAAHAAGYTGTDASLAVTASRLLNTASVRESLDRLVEKVERRTIADIARVIEVLSEPMEGKAPAEWTSVTGGNGAEVVAGRRYKPQAAATALGTMLTAAAAQPAQHNTLVLADLDPEVLRALYKHMISGGGGT